MNGHHERTQGTVAVHHADPDTESTVIYDVVSVRIGVRPRLRRVALYDSEGVFRDTAERGWVEVVPLVDGSIEVRGGGPIVVAPGGTDTVRISLADDPRGDGEVVEGTISEAGVTLWST